MNIHFLPEFLYDYRHHSKLSYLKRSGIIHCHYLGRILFEILSYPTEETVVFPKDIAIHFKSYILSRHVIDSKFHKTTCGIKKLFSSIDNAMEIAECESQIYPRIFAVTERSRPSQILMALVSGSVKAKYIRFDYATRKANVTYDHAEVFRLVNEHYSNHNGEIRMFGKITEYIYYTSQHDGYCLDTNGSYTGPSTREDPCATGSILIK